MEEKNIVAIDLGTSKIALTVAKVSGEDIFMESVFLLYPYLENSPKF